MNRPRWMPGLLLVALLAAPTFAQAPKAAAKRTISAEDRAKIDAGIAGLDKALAPLAGRTFGDTVSPADAVADASVASKAAKWIVRHGEFFAEDSVAKTMRTLDLGLERAKMLADGKHPWTVAKGGVARGFVSKIDGSVQPYAVYVPEAYDGLAPMRLDVILHGRDATLTEVKFLMAHQSKPYPKDESGLLLHVFGRGNNAYRWAGETDVLEAIEAVKRNYRVDDRRILLRGFSMGGAGAWHLGLHRPNEWCAVEAGAGFTETKLYAKVNSPRDYQEKALHIYDAVDYAANAREVPIAGYGGEDDPQRQASQNIADALTAQGVKMTTEGLVTKAEGLDFLRAVGAKTGHSIDPASAKILKAFRDDRAAKGQPERRKSLRFVTYTLKYNDAGWVSIEALKEHYAKATIEADIEGDTATIRAANVTILGVDREAADKVKFGEQVFPLQSAVKGLLPMVYFRLLDSGWEPLDYDQSIALIQNKAGRKRPNLQGPIDDAFTGPFLCVRGTGKPRNDAAETWAKARLDTFAAEWSEFLRGELPIKDDSAVTDEDVETKHLILFGDPGSNRLIARVVADLPMKWTKAHITLSGEHDAATHVPTLIAASPLNRLKYVVLNSGHTFGSRDFLGTNAMLYPRLGDWAVLKIGEDSAVASGYFDERWLSR
jgi:pimeloyl-ACP methyl ester carboxylesterase